MGKADNAKASAKSQQGTQATARPPTGGSRWPSAAYLWASVALAALAVLLAVVAERHRLQGQPYAAPQRRPPRVWVAGNNVDSGYLGHVLNVFSRLGFHRGSEEDFDALWSHPYPFRIYNDTMLALKSHQQVNHFPGSGYITSKVELSTSGIKHIPTAFKMPQEVELLRAFAAANPEKLFVKKSNTHRNIRISSIEDEDFSSNGTFFQEYIDNPLLVDGYKFDLGIYTVMTSLDPLRVYVYWGDVLIRFCPETYHPFDAALLDKYVVGDHYLPVWEVPSLARYHDTLKLGHRESLNAYLRSQGREPQRIWDQIDESIRSVYTVKEKFMKASARRFQRSARQFFELVRFDFVVDDQLNVFLMEANMSPNLSSAHFKQNGQLYEQVVYSVLSLVGVASRLSEDLRHLSSGPVAEMLAADKDLAVYGAECGSFSCMGTCSGLCRVCMPCTTLSQRATLRQALLEHLNRHLTRRILPAPTTPEVARTGLQGLEELSLANQLMHLWFRGKCLLDRTFC